MLKPTHSPNKFEIYASTTIATLSVFIANLLMTFIKNKLNLPSITYLTIFMIIGFILLVLFQALFNVGYVLFQRWKEYKTIKNNIHKPL